MSLVNTITSTLVPVHREGWRFVAIATVVTVMLYWFDLDFLALLALVVTLWCAYFFRDPERVTPVRAGLVISPAVEGASRVLLVDDVCTHGSTVGVIAKAMRAVEPAVEVVAATAGQMVIKPAVVHPE